MLLHLVCVFAIGIPLVIAYLGNRDNDNKNRIPAVNESTRNQEITSEDVSSTLSDEQDGVSIEVEIEESGPSQTSFILNLNNHAYDLSTMDIKGLSHLNNVQASSYELVDSQTGGHHAKARITFPTAPAGELHIGLNEEISFYFNL